MDNTRSSIRNFISIVADNPESETPDECCSPEVETLTAALEIIQGYSNCTDVTPAVQCITAILSTLQPSTPVTEEDVTKDMAPHIDSSGKQHYEKSSGSSYPEKKGFVGP